MGEPYLILLPIFEKINVYFTYKEKLFIKANLMHYQPCTLSIGQKCMRASSFIKAIVHSSDFHMSYVNYIWMISFVLLCTDRFWLQKISSHKNLIQPLQSIVRHLCSVIYNLHMTCGLWKSELWANERAMHQISFQSHTYKWMKVLVIGQFTLSFWSCGKPTKLIITISFYLLSI